MTYNLQLNTQTCGQTATRGFSPFPHLPCLGTAVIVCSLLHGRETNCIRLIKIIPQLDQTSHENRLKIANKMDAEYKLRHVHKPIRNKSGQGPVEPKPPLRIPSASSSTVMPKGINIPCAKPCPASIDRVFSLWQLVIRTIMCPSLSE